MKKRRNALKFLAKLANNSSSFYKCHKLNCFFRIKSPSHKTILVNVKIHNDANSLKHLLKSILELEKKKAINNRFLNKNDLLIELMVEVLFNFLYLGIVFFMIIANGFLLYMVSTYSF